MIEQDLIKLLLTVNNGLTKAKLTDMSEPQVSDHRPCEVVPSSHAAIRRLENLHGDSAGLAAFHTAGRGLPRSA